MHFFKVEGIGNDFVLLDRRHEAHEGVVSDLRRLSGLAPELCDRRRGIGADGLLIVGPPPPGSSSAATMWVINADGSRPEMCGNGLRCVAHYVAHVDGTPALTIATDAGPKDCLVEAPHAVQAAVEVDMGPGRPQAPPALTVKTSHAFASVSMGNPHAIAFVEENPEPLARTLGPLIEVDPAFPARTNVEFARIDRANERIELWVWERGVGITEACGTGACATACAAVWSGRAEAESPLAIDLPGGRLTITVPHDRGQGVRMRGASRFVFKGEYGRPPRP